METELPEETNIREYLLGRLQQDTPELSERLEERLLADDDFSRTVDLVEDEIIEEYLEGTLDAADKQTVEQHFLRPPERQKKLRFARLLHHHLETMERGVRQESAPPSVSWRSHFRSYAERAAILLVTVASVIYIGGLRRGYQFEISQRKHELGQERERSTELARQVQSLRNLQQPSMVLLNLLQPVARDNQAFFPQLEIGSATQKIHAEIVLPGAPAGKYDVQLETLSGKMILSKTRIPLLQAKDTDPVLIFDLPSQGIQTGDYQFVIRQLQKAYPFHINVL